ncbi:pilus assembly protein [Zobellella taiwanensis]|uniref:Pilus assembly protein n=1 Tax=Zobellella taiwanensis TaxID=347535 RepID=A0A2P7R9R9_9GAMM|nr:pilus assembly protein [Zobellella taiwanensis]PSJ46933.1 pilus assembly protein [Zobellella taiwanensis]
MNIAKELLRLVNDEEGLTTVEYAIAGALVAAAVVTAFTQLGNSVGAQVERLCDAASTGVSDASVTCDRTTP